MPKDQKLNLKVHNCSILQTLFQSFNNPGTGTPVKVSNLVGVFGALL